jgi:hypothetical protein
VVAQLILGGAVFSSTTGIRVQTMLEKGSRIYIYIIFIVKVMDA